MKWMWWKWTCSLGHVNSVVTVTFPPKLLVSTTIVGMKLWLWLQLVKL